MTDETNSRIESELEVRAYIQDLKFALNNGAKIDFQKRELLALSVEDYMQTVKDLTTTFVMSFHFAEKPFMPEMFPYKKK